MGRYSVIAEISEEIMERLNSVMVPELAADNNCVALCSPQDRGECTLGVFLYDIQESDEMRRISMIDLDENRRKGPPVCLNLYYMITAYSQADKRYRMIQEQQILGKVIQYFHDNPRLESAEQTRVQLLKISTEDKFKLWNFNGCPYSVSLFYQVSPVMLDSEIIQYVSRVKSIDVRAERMAADGKQ